jgi:pimeloyl-ACP methyl ester carboxylesterase
MDIILIAGLWLPTSIWGDVASHLVRLGHRPLPVALPGVDDGATDATLEDQLTAVLAAVDGADRPLVVGHSAACTLAWMAADRRPDAIRSVILIGGFPASDGEAYADFLPIEEGVMAFPGWEPFEGPDAADLAATERSHFEAIAVPVAEGVARGVVRLADDRRHDVPLVLVCPEYSPEQAKAWIDAGDVPELTGAAGISYANIDSGHWPMITRPSELGRILDAATRVG